MIDHPTLQRLLPLAGCAPHHVEDLLDAAFGSDRRQRTAYRLREGMAAVDHLSFGIVEGNALTGSIQCWPVSLVNGNDGVPLILVGPVAVSPERQNMGLGHQLMNAMLAATAPADAPMLMIGDPEYYGRFGFVADETSGWKLPGPWEPRRLLLRNPQALDLPQTGIVGPRV
ncbi:MAG: N-acetyltransferase [Sphingorhabdus sp.]